MENNKFDAFDEAFNAKPREFEIFGQVRVDAHYLFFPGNKQMPVPFDPTIHPEDKRTTEVELRMIPIAEQNITWDEFQRMLTFSPDWTKIVLPSIKEIGMTNLRELNNQWVRVAKVPGNRKRLNKLTREETGEFWPTYRFIEVFADEAACKAAYLGDMPESTESDQSPTDNERAVALAFIEVFVTAAAKHITDRKVIEAQVADDISKQSAVSGLFTVQSPEVQRAIDKALAQYM